MLAFIDQFKHSFIPYLERVNIWPVRKKPAPAAPVFSYRTSLLSPAKQRALHELCEQLFQKKEVLTSGRLRLIGLAQIRKRMGKRWDGLCQVVYDTVEDVIEEHIGKSDIFVRYADDTYVIIFAHADIAAGEATAAIIAEEVRKRLFLLDEKALREIEIKKTVRQLTPRDLGGFDSADFLGAFEDYDTGPVINTVLKDHDTDPREKLAALDIEARDYKPEPKKIVASDILPELHFSYRPIWDVKRAALNTYVCLAEGAGADHFSLENHKLTFYALNADIRLAADLQILAYVRKELAAMVEDGRKFLIACPVCHETLSHYESYEVYKEQLEAIPAEQRQFLVLLILKPEKPSTAKDAYWFLPAIKPCARFHFAEVPLKQGVNYQAMKAVGFDAVGVALDSTVKEQQALSVLGGFSNAAKSHKIPLTFVMGVSTLSMTTSSVCAGFDYIGGPAIHDVVSHPDAIHKCRHEDIVTSLIKK